MQRFRDETDAVDCAIASIYDTLLDPGRWVPALPGLSQVFDAPMVAIWSYDQAAGHAYDFQALGFDPVAARRYVEHYSAIDPATPVVLSSPVGRWNSDERLLDPSAPEQWEYVHDFALPAGVGRVGGVRVLADARHSVYFGAQRPPGAAEFGESAARLSKLVVPHLARAAKMHLGLSEAAAQRSWSLAALDAFSASVCVVDERARVLCVNKAAGEDLSPDAPLRMRNGRLTASSPSIQDRLEAALRAAFEWPRVASGFLTAPSPHDAGVRHAMVVPLQQAHELARDFAGPVAMVVLNPPRGCPRTPVRREVWSSQYDLTVAEVALLEALVGGVALEDFACAHHVAMSTVRTHVASLLTKTGVNSQARLVALAGTTGLLR